MGAMLYYYQQIIDNHPLSNSDILKETPSNRNPIRKT